MKQISPRSLECHKKDVIALRNWLQGRNYGMAAFALEYASRYHTSKRKDKITPEFNHMVLMTSLARTLSDKFSFCEETLSTTLLHDLPEDIEGITFEKIEKDFKKEWNVQKPIYEREGLKRFKIKRFMKALRNITKKYDGVKIPPEVYYEKMKDDPVCSIVKGIDRLHNLATCGKVFDHKKKKQYIKETEEYILPMIKQAQRNFPQQNNVYENIKLMLKIVINTIEDSFDLE